MERSEQGRGVEGMGFAYTFELWKGSIWERSGGESIVWDFLANDITSNQPFSIAYPFLGMQLA